METPIPVDAEAEAPEAPHSRSNSVESHDSTESLRSSDLEIVSENGRTYPNAEYYLPSDSAEQIRLSILHQIFLSALGGSLTSATLPSPDQVPTDAGEDENSEPYRILDIGAGAGDWALAIADAHPYAEVTAIDIAVYDLDDYASLPTNVTFQIGDLACENWDFGDQFDFIHLRGMAGAFSDWAMVYSEAMAALVPGGVIEVADFDFSVLAAGCSEKSALRTLVKATGLAAKKAGYTLDIQHLKKYRLAMAGFQDVKMKTVNVPIGQWPEDEASKALGKMWLVCVMEGLEASCLRLLTKEAGWTKEEVSDICDKAKEELMVGQGKKKLMTPFYFVTGRKPAGEEEED